MGKKIGLKNMDNLWEQRTKEQAWKVQEDHRPPWLSTPKVGSRGFGWKTYVESINSEIKAKKEQWGHEKYCPIDKIELLEHLP